MIGERARPVYKAHTIAYNGTGATEHRFFRIEYECVIVGPACAA